MIQAAALEKIQNKVNLYDIDIDLSWACSVVFPSFSSFSFRFLNSFLEGILSFS